jgi:uncharacterized protein YjbI with pentapeptide repeats
MLEPRRAPVRPRVVSPLSGETLLLEDEILSLLECGESGIVWLVGGPGAGKTTALAHLAAVLPASDRLILHDDDWPIEPEWRKLYVGRGVVGSAPKAARFVYELARWGDDEIIEYLLAQHRDRCPSVVRRCQAAEHNDLLSGNPELWQSVLDLLAADDAIATVKDALRRLLDRRFTVRLLRERVASWCLGVFQAFGPDNGTGRLLGAKFGWDVEDFRKADGWGRLLWHSGVMLLLAAERFAAELRATEPCPFLEYAFPREVIDETAALIRDDTRVLSGLKAVMVSSQRESQPTAASLLHTARIAWRPERLVLSGLRKLLSKAKSNLPRLDGAYLEGAEWPGIDLARAELNDADFNHADLRNADLSETSARRANLRSAKLSGANLHRFKANDASLSGADLSYVRARSGLFDAADAEGACFEGALLENTSFRDAKLTGASFVRANLSRAAFVNAEIEGADFSQAELTGALLTGLALRLAEFRQCSFAEAVMVACDLEGMTLPGADFARANLKGSLLTGTVIPRADFCDANLVNTGLAEIDWEQADLRGADLRGASFHMGSSRSGLVDSPIASYGSRTGFYTDDYNEQDFKSPEEIRKANLRGADLREAKISGVDFYLVDLRDARYDAEQEQHFRSCGAILESRVP